MAFARELPAHNLLFLPRDITQPKALAPWVHKIDRGAGRLLAFRRGEDIGCAAMVRDPLSWSPHVAALRVVVARAARGIGLGRVLSADAGSSQ